jgi:cell division protein FtsL
MKRAYVYALLITVPLLLLAVAWQAGRYDSLAAEARRLEASQESWVQENRKLEAGIRVLSSRERAAALAESLGLEKAGPERRVRIVVQPQAKAAGTSPAPASGAPND